MRTTVASRLYTPILLSVALLAPLKASAGLIGDEVSVLLNIYLDRNSATATEVFNQTAVVADPGGPELSRDLTSGGVLDGTATLHITLDLLGDGFLLSFECIAPDSNSSSGCEFGYDQGDLSGNPSQWLGFTLSLSDLNWTSPPAALTAVGIVFGGNFVSTDGGDDMVETGPVITPTSYAASFSGSFLGTGGPSDSGSVAGTFTVVERSVPEPSVILLLLLGLALLASQAWRQRLSRVAVPNRAQR